MIPIRSGTELFNSPILDNCHVRIAFACNDERTARRISDALGTATEFKAMRNYAGHRLVPWLSHLMVSHQETGRALLTPGEVMQLPATDEIVMVAGMVPIRAQKIRYYADPAFRGRVHSAPALAENGGPYPDQPAARLDDWTGFALPGTAASPPDADGDRDAGTEGGLRREPELPEHEEVAPPPPPRDPAREFDLADEADDKAAQRAAMDQARGIGQQVNRVAAMDRDDGLGLGM